MNKPVELPQAVIGRQTMTPSEAFVETLVAHGVTDMFGIMGSAYMDALDIFPLGRHPLHPGRRTSRAAAHMADGYARVSGRHGVCIAQNGPGITNFVTGDRRRLLGAYAGGRHHARDRHDDAGPRRLPGNQAAADLPEDHQVPGARQQPGAHGRMHRPRVRPRDARNGPDAAQHPARLLLRRDRVRDPAADRVERGAGGEQSLDEAARAAGDRQVPGDPVRRRRGDGRRRRGMQGAGRAPRRAGRQQLPAQRLVPGAAIRCGAARSATRARRRR